MRIPQQDYGSIRMVVQWCGSICLGLSVPGSWLLHTLASSHQGPEGAVMIRYTWTKIKLGATDLWLWIPGFHRIQTSWHRSALWNTDRHCAALNLSFYFYQVWKATLSNTICQLHLNKNEKKGMKWPLATLPSSGTYLKCQGKTCCFQDSKKNFGTLWIQAYVIIMKAIK